MFSGGDRDERQRRPWSGRVGGWQVCRKGVHGAAVLALVLAVGSCSSTNHDQAGPPTIVSCGATSDGRPAASVRVYNNQPETLQYNVAVDVYLPNGKLNGVAGGSANVMAHKSKTIHASDFYGEHHHGDTCRGVSLNTQEPTIGGRVAADSTVLAATSLD